MRKVRFLFYYGKLILTSWLGINKTANPLNIKWRWNYWQNIQAVQRRRRKK